MGDEKTVAFRMSGLSQAITIFTNIPADEVKMGMEVVLRKENIKDTDKKQSANVQKLLFEEKTGFLKRKTKDQLILNVSEEVGILYNVAENRNYQGYCAMVKKPEDKKAKTEEEKE